MSYHQVVIIGAGPAGLLLARLLTNQNIDCVILENRNEAFLRKNNRGGFLEQEVAQLLQRENSNCSIQEKGKAVDQIHFHYDDKKINLPIVEKKPIIYDQKNVVADLLDSLKTDAIPIIFEAKGQRYEGLTDDKVKVVYTLNGQIYSMAADYVAGCDGFRGISRRSIPKKLRQEIQQELPYAWLEWSVDKAPTNEAPIIAFHKNGFAMQTPSTNGQTRFYLQVKRGTEMDDLPSVDEIWTDIETRLSSSVIQGDMLHRKLDYMRFYSTLAMQYGRLFIAGDAAHQVPRFGSKGINLALRDADKLAKGFIAFYKNNTTTFLDNYSSRCVEGNRLIMQSTKKFNQIFHQEEIVEYTEKVKQIHQVLDNSLNSELIQFLTG